MGVPDGREFQSLNVRDIVMKAFISRQAPLVATIGITVVTLWLMIDAFRAAMIINNAFSA